MRCSWSGKCDATVIGAVSYEDLETIQNLCKYSLVRGRNAETFKAVGIMVGTEYHATIGRSAALIISWRMRSELDRGPEAHEISIGVIRGYC